MSMDKTVPMNTFKDLDYNESIRTELLKGQTIISDSETISDERWNINPLDYETEAGFFYKTNQPIGLYKNVMDVDKSLIPAIDRLLRMDIEVHPLLQLTRDAQVLNAVVGVLDMGEDVEAFVSGMEVQADLVQGLMTRITQNKDKREKIRSKYQNMLYTIRSKTDADLLTCENVARLVSLDMPPMTAFKLMEDKHLNPEVLYRLWKCYPELLEEYDFSGWTPNLLHRYLEYHKTMDVKTFRFLIDRNIPLSLGSYFEDDKLKRSLAKKVKECLDNASYVNSLTGKAVSDPDGFPTRKHELSIEINLEIIVQLLLYHEKTIPGFIKAFCSKAVNMNLFAKMLTKHPELVDKDLSTFNDEKVRFILKFGLDALKEYAFMDLATGATFVIESFGADSFLTAMMLTNLSKPKIRELVKGGSIIKDPYAYALNNNIDADVLWYAMLVKQVFEIETYNFIELCKEPGAFEHLITVWANNFDISFIKEPVTELQARAIRMCTEFGRLPSEVELDSIDSEEQLTSVFLRYGNYEHIENIRFNLRKVWEIEERWDNIQSLGRFKLNEFRVWVPK